MQKQAKRASAVALGLFDGIHIGHASLLRRMVAIAKENDLSSMVYTFENHPATLLGITPALLMTPDERRRAMHECGVETVHMCTFDRKMAETPAEDFIDELVERYDVRAIVAGFNYNFGKNATGNETLLREMGEKKGFIVHIEAPVQLGGDAVSSTRIRKALKSGDIVSANEMFGYTYALEGTVVENRRIGRTIGFPTANILPTEGKLLPKAGVYATRAYVRGQWHDSITNVGTNPTVGGERTSVETHILDFDGDIYGDDMKVEFLLHARGEVKFDSKEMLAEQIACDVGFVRAHFAKAIERVGCPCHSNC